MKVFVPVIAWVVASLAAACGGSAGPTGSGQTPTEAYRLLHRAVQAKDPAAIRSVLSEGTLRFAEARASQTGESVDHVIRNGFSAPAMDPGTPQIRDEQVLGTAASIEVYNPKTRAWEMMPFVLENGGWKLAVGDAFANTWKPPGKTQTQREIEAANTAGPQMVPGANVDFNKVRPDKVDPTRGKVDGGPNPIANSKIKPVKIPTH